MTERRLTPELRRAALSGARWMAMSRFVAELAALSSSVVVARLIPPAEFGRAAVALIVIALSAILSTAGVSAPLVQRRELTNRLVASVVVLAVVLGAALALATVAVALTLVEPIFGERTEELMLLAAPAWMLVAVGAPSQALLQRRLRFGALAGIEVGSVLGSAGVAVALALAGIDGEAIVAAGLTLVGLTSLLSFAAEPPRAFRTDRRTLRKTLGFATPLALSSLVYIGFRNVDYAILGARSTPAQVGYYWRAYQLGVGYQAKISRVMLRVSFPVYSRAADLDELRVVRTYIVRAHATVLVPLLAAFVAMAPVFIPWLYGDTWEPAVRPAQILAIAGMADAVVTGVGPLMVAIGRPGTLLRYNIVVLCVFALLVFGLAPYGIEVVAVGVALFSIGNVLGAQATMLRPHLGLPFRQLWTDTRAGIGAGAAVVVGTVAARKALEPLGLPDAVFLFLLGVIAILVYGIVLRLLFPTEWQDLRAIVGRMRGSRASGEAPAAADEGTSGT